MHKLLYSLFVVLPLCLGACSLAPVKVPIEPTPVPEKSVFTMTYLSPTLQVRSVEKATRAALDFAAYYQNPIRESGMDEIPEGYVGRLAAWPITKYPFPMLDSLTRTEPQTFAGLTAIAPEPFAKELREKCGKDKLSPIIQSVESVKWEEPNVFRAFQKVTRLWGVPQNGTLEWWVEVTPAFWTNRPVFYAHLKGIQASPQEIKTLQDYLTVELNKEEALNWARTLASYWYPTLNTDLEVHTPGAEWRGNRPFAVMRGNPMGTPIWVAFDVPSFRLTDQEITALNAPSATITLASRTMDTSSAFRLQTLASIENTCPETEVTKAFREALMQKLKSLPKEQNAWENSGWLWFRRNANYVIANKITSQDSLHNPLPRLLELKKYLDSLNIQLLVVPVPTKEELYPDRLIPGTPQDLCVNPHGRDFVREMLMAGIDVLDLYPALAAARGGDVAPHFAYQRYDTHWATPGLLAAMEQLAARVTAYSWYAEAGAHLEGLEMRDTITLREGDLVAHLPEGEKLKFAPDTLPVVQIFRNGEPYKGPREAPILLMGDSFTGVFESVDAKSGGPGSLLAYATGLDVEVLTSWGGGPGVRHRMLKAQKSLVSKRLVIYMMTARDFWQSPMEWDGLEFDEQK